MKPISSTIHAEGDNASSICDNRKQPAKFILNNKLNSKYEQFKLRQITATIADNIGFTSASSTSINSLTFLMQSYFQHLCHESSEVANHAGRDFVTLDDASKVFSEQDINLVELHDYINQVENFGFQNQLPLFPVPFTISDTSTEMHPQSEKQQLVEAVTETDHNNKIELDNEKRTKASDKGEQRTNIRLTQRTFPKFMDAFAQDLGITVQKVVPPEVHIEDEADFTRTLQHFATSFTIMSKLTNLVGPSLSVKAISQEVRHKSKKRKRERDIGEKDPQPYKKHRSKEEKRRNKESKRTYPVQDSQGTSVGVLPKVPKIKIRFGPGPSQNEQKTSTAYSEPMDDSPSLAAAPDKEIVKEEDQIKEAATTSSSLPAPRMEKSPEKPTHQLVPPLRIMKSPPKPGLAPLKVSAIADPDPQSLSSVGIKPNVEFIISQPKEKPESISGNLHDTQIDELELSRQSPITPIREKSSTLPVVKLQSKKRTRKSEKPTWMDPSLFSTLESSPPGISPAPSKALESIVPVETTNKVQTVNPQKGGNKPPEPILTEKKNVKSGAGHTKSAAMIHQTKTGTVETPKPPKEKEIKTKSDGKATSETSSKQLPSISQQPADGDGIDQEEEDIWICPVCSVAYVENGPAMVACDQCDRWFHWACVGILIEPPDNAPWFCTECKRKRKKQQQSGNGSSSGNAAHQPKKKQR